jgi:hypothetical protein
MLLQKHLRIPLDPRDGLVKLLTKPNAAVREPRILIVVSVAEIFLHELKELYRSGSSLARNTALQLVQRDSCHLTRPVGLPARIQQDTIFGADRQAIIDRCAPKCFRKLELLTLGKLSKSGKLRERHGSEFERRRGRVNLDISWLTFKMSHGRAGPLLAPGSALISFFMRRLRRGHSECL